MQQFSTESGQSERGMTLVELLITMTIVGVIMGGVTRSFVNQRRIAAIQNQRVTLIQQAQAAMDLVTRELRTAGSNPKGITFVPVAYDESQKRLEIQADLDGDENTTGADEHLIYVYDQANQRITRDAGSGAQPLVEHIQEFKVTPLDSAGVKTSDNSKIRQLQIKITAQTAAPDPKYTAYGGYRRFTMTSLIALRN